MDGSARVIFVAFLVVVIMAVCGVLVRGNLLALAVVYLVLLALALAGTAIGLVQTWAEGDDLYSWERGRFLTPSLTALLTLFALGFAFYLAALYGAN